MAAEVVQIQTEIQAPLEQVFEWFYHSENFIQSPIVFRSQWMSPVKWTSGSQRDIIMIAGRYFEEIIEVEEQRYIRYRVNRSFPAVRQDFTEIRFDVVDPHITRVTWTIEVEVPVPIIGKGLNYLAGKMAGILYRTILTAGKKELEANEVK